MSTLVVTGGSRGIGAATCVAAAQTGWDVVVDYARDEAAAAAVVRRITDAGGHAVAVRAGAGPWRAAEACGIGPQGLFWALLPLDRASAGATVGIVGATGAVGQELIALLQAHAFPLAELRTLASARSAGRSIDFGVKKITVLEATPDAFAGLDLAFRNDRT